MKSGSRLSRPSVGSNVRCGIFYIRVFCEVLLYKTDGLPEIAQSCVFYLVFVGLL